MWEFTVKAQGAVQGFAGSLGGLASILGLIAGGVLYPALGPATFAVSAATIFVVALLSLRLFRVQRGLGACVRRSI